MYELVTCQHGYVMLALNYRKRGNLDSIVKYLLKITTHNVSTSLGVCLQV